MDDEQYCYSLAELAARWNCSENDILHKAIQSLPQRKQDSDWCSLALLVKLSRFQDPNGRVILGWKQLILPDEISGFFPNNDDAVFSAFLNYKDKKTLTRVKQGENGECLLFTLYRDEIIIMGDEVRQYEERNRLVAVEDKVSIDLSLSMILNSRHPWYSEPLANAVQAWIELYSKREGNKLDNSYRPAGGNSNLIDKWLDAHIKNIGKTTKEHYRFIINPSKQGGPKKIPE